MLLGLQQEVARAVASQQRDEEQPRAGGSRVVDLGLRVGLVGAALWLLTSPVWGERLFGKHWLVMSVAMALGCIGYSVYAVVNGALAGRQLWSDYALSIATDAALRLVLVLPVMLLGIGLAGQSWALNAAALAWVLLLVRSGFRNAVTARVPGSLGTLASGATHAMVATGCSAVLISGFPVLLRLTSSGPLGPEAGVLLAAVVATRGPLLLPLSAFQALLLTRLVLNRDRVWSILGRLLGLVGGVTLVGMLGAYVVGPLLLRLLYGSQFRIEPGPLAFLVMAAGLIAAQTLTGAALMAQGRHRAFAAGWLVSALVVVALLSLDLSVNARSSLALNVGPLVGMTVNLASLASHQRHRP
jgi:O-antigen/teichoic acid export membrane protein